MGMEAVTPGGKALRPTCTALPFTVRTSNRCIADLMVGASPHTGSGAHLSSLPGLRNHNFERTDAYGLRFRHLCGSQQHVDRRIEWFLAPNLHVPADLHGQLLRRHVGDFADADLPGADLQRPATGATPSGSISFC